jgi:hypothetical protein
MTIRTDSRRIVARFLAALNEVATEFPTEDALNKYLQEHPKADKSKHTVKKHEDGEGGSGDEKPKPGTVPKGLSEKEMNGLYEDTETAYDKGEITDKQWHSFKDTWNKELDEREKGGGEPKSDKSKTQHAEPSFNVKNHDFSKPLPKGDAKEMVKQLKDQLSSSELEEAADEVEHHIQKLESGKFYGQQQGDWSKSEEATLNGMYETSGLLRKAIG